MMKKFGGLLILFSLIVSPVLADELLAPGDMIIAVDSDGPISASDYPDAESPANILDGDINTKYLNFGGWSRYNTGFIVTPAAGASTVMSFQISTANDAAGRDPVTYALYGTNEAIASADNSTGLAENWTLIGTGSVALPDDRQVAGPVVNVANDTAYTSYKMTFPEIKNGVNGGLMQVSEIDFFDGADGLGSDLLAVGDSILAIQATPDSNYPQAEGPGNLVDGADNKFLNFGKENCGFIITPSMGDSLVTAFQIKTANDSPERDPASWILYGTNDDITSADNSQGLEENWILIDSGDLLLTDDRLVLGDMIDIDNAAVFTSYKMLFPTLKDSGAANSMQISEIQFYGVPEPMTLVLVGLGSLMIRRRK